MKESFHLVIPATSLRVNFTEHKNKRWRITIESEERNEKRLIVKSTNISTAKRLCSEIIENFYTMTKDLEVFKLHLINNVKTYAKRKTNNKRNTKSRHKRNTKSRHKRNRKHT